MRRPGAAEAHTFSIVGVDPATGEVGIAVASRFLAVGSAVPWVRAGVGGVATQAWVNVTYGPEGLRLLADGRAPADVVERLVADDEYRDRRQVGVLDAHGRGAVWTGRKCMAWAGHIVGRGYVCQGNLLTGAGVLDAMAEAYERAPGALPERLIDALDAGQARGGDSRGEQAAGLRVARAGGSYLGLSDEYIDLRVDDATHPLPELRRLLALHRAQRPLQREIDAFVAAAHADLDAVRDAVAARPVLVHARASWEENAIEAAAHSGRADIVEVLAAAGAGVDICTAALLGQRDRVAAMLAADPALVAATGAHGIPVLYFAARGGHAAIVELLVTHGAALDAPRGTPAPLHGAAQGGHADLALWLIGRGADRAARDDHGRTPAELARDLGHTALAQSLGV